MAEIYPDFAAEVTVTIPNGTAIQVVSIESTCENEEAEVTHLGSAKPAAGQAGGREFMAAPLGKLAYDLTVHYSPDQLDNVLGGSGVFSIGGPSTGALITGDGVCTAYSGNYVTNTIMEANMSIVYNGVATITNAT